MSGKDRYDNAGEEIVQEGNGTGSALGKCRADTFHAEVAAAREPFDETLAESEREIQEQLIAEEAAERVLSETEGFENTVQGQQALKATTAESYNAPRAEIEGKEDLRAEEVADLRKGLAALAARQANDDASDMKREPGRGVGDEAIDELLSLERNEEGDRDLHLEPTFAPSLPAAEENRTVSMNDGFDALSRARAEQEEAEREREGRAPADAEKERSVNRQRAVDAKSRALGIGVVVVGVIAIAVLSIGYLGGGKETGAVRDEAADETAEMMKGLKQVSPSDLRGLKKREASPRENYGMPEEEKPATGGEEAKPSFAPTRSAGTGQRQPSSGGPSGSNFEKDRDIIEQYKNIDPAAAAAGNPEGGSSLRYRPRPFSAGSTSDTKGGVYYTNRPDAKGGKEDTGALPLHDVQVQSRLKFSIRSSASNQITAVSDADLEGLPAGSIFYGSGSFSNKRTYVQFNKVRVGDREYSIKGYAVSGKDPGIASEVIEIENNAKITFTSGVTDAAGKVLDNLVSTATGGTTSGIVSGTAGEVKDKNEQERARYEYRVGAGTGFIIYIE